MTSSGVPHSRRSAAISCGVIASPPPSPPASARVDPGPRTTQGAQGVADRSGWWAMSRAAAFVPLAQTTRSGAPESVHFGAVVALDRDGAIVACAGDPNVVIYPRSSNKPLQAMAMVRNGLVLPPELLAL